MEHWIDKKVKLKQQFAILLDKDLNLIEGHKEEMLSKIQMKLSLSREELLKIIAGL
jgi:molybdopterin-guanine dinucleotide biosynthesis protein